MNKWMWSTALVVVAASTALGAQTAKGMQEPKMDEKMDAMKTTYTGCVEAAGQGASILLTHIAEDKPMMHDDKMMHGDKPMAHDDQMMHEDAMKSAEAMIANVVLTGRADLKKYVGQKVTVSGSLSHGMADAMAPKQDTLAISSLKVVAKSCSQK